MPVMVSTAPLTPKDLAERWGITADQVCRLIAAGAMPRAFSVSKPGAKKPRWRIPIEAITDYESTRTARPPAPSSPRRRRRAAEPGFINYFD
jgi:hypothetical protein